MTCSRRAKYDSHKETYNCVMLRNMTEHYFRLDKHRATQHSRAGGRGVDRLASIRTAEWLERQFRALSETGN